jgi:hypothetical protein
LAKWALIPREHDFNIVNMASRVNWNVDRLSRNPSSSEEDTTGARWHGEVDLEAILGWHAFANLCILLGCFTDVPHGNMSSGNSHNNDDELEGNDALNIHLDLFIMAYLQASEVLVGLTPKEQDRVIHRVKQF